MLTIMTALALAAAAQAAPATTPGKAECEKTMGQMAHGKAMAAGQAGNHASMAGPEHAKMSGAQMKACHDMMQSGAMATKPDNKTPQADPHGGHKQ